jgi:hypothetical protein
MIHKMILSPTIRDHLTEIVQLQIDLLYYAATNKEINKTTCASYLDEKPLDPRFIGRGDAIAIWLWASGTSKRHNHLVKFASTYTSTHLDEQRAEQQQKKDWCLRLAKEVAMLSNSKLPFIEIASFFGDAPLPNCKKKLTYTWKGEASCFLLYFYENFIGDDEEFPKELFPTARPFGRQAFLDAFLAANSSLEICAICDESRYFTQGKEHIYASIDHFLPKSRYPHFACHPYNLIPICHACNSSLKGRKDPLEMNSPSRLLNGYSLPYHDVNWGTDAYLKVNLSTEIEFSAPLVLRKDTSGQTNIQKEDALKLLSALYDIPGRWPAGKISETLFRRMRQFLGNGKGGPQSFDMPSEVNNTLEQLLYYLDQEDRQKDPFAFAMTWVLVAILEDQIQPLLNGQKGFHSPLLSEIMSWFGQDPDKNQSRVEIARSLRAVPKQ